MYRCVVVNRLADMSMARLEIDEEDAAPEASEAERARLALPTIWQRPGSIAAMLLGSAIVTGLAVSTLVRPEFYQSSADGPVAMLRN